MKALVRKPRKGDRVVLALHSGEFEVVKVTNAGMLVDLKIINPPPKSSPGYIEKRIPWSALIYLDAPREDVNQAAARIVREATEK